MSPKIPLEKKKERKNRKSEGKEEKKQWLQYEIAAMLTSSEIENCLMGELCFGCNLLKTEI